MTIDVSHLRNYDKALCEALALRPADYLPLLEAAAVEVLREWAVEQRAAEGGSAEEGAAAAAGIRSIQVMLTASEPFGPRSIREINVRRLPPLSFLIFLGSPPPACRFALPSHSFRRTAAPLPAPSLPTRPPRAHPAPSPQPLLIPSSLPSKTPEPSSLPQTLPPERGSSRST